MQGHCINNVLRGESQLCLMYRIPNVIEEMGKNIRGTFSALVEITDSSGKEKVVQKYDSATRQL